MKYFSNSNPFLLAGVALAVSLFLIGCNNSRVSQKMLDREKKIYAEETAAVISGGGTKVVDYELFPVTEKKVVVAAWKSAYSASNYYNDPGQLDTLDAKYFTWIVQAEEYKTLGRKFQLDRLKGQRLALRLEQALGLPPTADTTRVFVILEVDAEDLFRPCRDPEIEDCNCWPQWPVGAHTDTTAYGPVYRDLVGSTTDFPWTRMGYTYDWIRRSRDHFGFSEYVIKRGSVAKVLAKEKTEDWLDGIFAN
jgi:hypothetical protein